MSDTSEDTKRKQRQSKLSQFLFENAELFTIGPDEADLEGEAVVTGAVLVIRYLDTGDDGEAVLAIPTVGLGATATVGMLALANSTKIH